MSGQAEIVERRVRNKIQKGSLSTRRIDSIKAQRRASALESKLVTYLNNTVEIPEVADHARRLETKESLRLFCEYYFPNKFNLGWSTSHLDLFKVMEECVLQGGGTFSFALPRGSGKTSIAETCALWALFHAHKRYVVCLSARGELGKSLFQSIRAEIENNELLAADFPEIIHPILEGEFNQLRYRNQDVNGKKTKITYTSDSVSLPEVEGSPASGSFIRCGSIGSSLRGMKRTTASGVNLRPDFVIVDDPQTDTSAKSKSQTAARERIIQGAILGLAGPRDPITVVMPCTVIQRGDLADKFLDRELKPEWQGIRSKLLNKFPENMDLWMQYWEIRSKSYREGRRGVDATDFYRLHQEEMDKGAEVTWTERYKPPFELSAIQHAMNLYFNDPSAFASEYQNEPLTQATGEDRPTIDLQSKDIITRLSGYPLGTIPRDTLFVTSGVDIQQDVLYWLTVAWTEDFGGVICDYGTFPEQPTAYFDTHNIQNKLQHKFPQLTGGVSPLCYQGLQSLRHNVFTRLYRREDSENMAGVDSVFIDANWNRTTDAVYQFCREAGDKYQPCQGVGIGAAMLPMSEWVKRQGDQPHKDNWRFRLATLQKNRGKYICYDTNFWKSRMGERLTSTMPNKNALMLYGKSIMQHQLLADHLSSEYPIRTSGRGRDVDEWRTKVHVSENHWFDCLVLAGIAASKCGLQLHDVTVTTKAGNIEELSAVPIPPKVRKVAALPPRRRVD